MKMRRKCRIWWPEEVSLTESCLLFGWSFCCSAASLDIVVGYSSNKVASQYAIEDILREANTKMPTLLQDNSAISLLGQCTVSCRSNGGLSKFETHELHQNSFIASESGSSCGCDVLDGSIKERAFNKSSHWVNLIYDFHEQSGRKLHGIPKLHHIHWNGKIVSQCDVHVIAYETPTYGVQHFSLSLSNSSQRQDTPCKKPKWVDDLRRKHPLSDIDLVLLALNCTSAAKTVHGRHVNSEKSISKFSLIRMILAFAWQLLAIVLASLSTIFYILIQFFNSVSDFWSQTWVGYASVWILKATWTIFNVRSSQILYWPVFLHENDLRSLSCVPYAEKAALHRHSIWSSLAVDVLLGNIIGFAFLFHEQSICLWTLNLANEFTNYFLRSGCVWLMGVPAGFKLNTEMAEVLGMVSLNAIQIWSTLWFFIGIFIKYFVRAISVCGIIFGLTPPAALVKDVIVFASLHVSALHRIMAILYSHQIQALAALWRLFRGRKWNPLRHRLDSYDYSVKQHIIGSLVFTPLLLLLPTTSVFYIFFTIVHTSISSVCMLIEVTISFILGTPYTEIILWLVRRRRFPSGIWFDILSSKVEESRDGNDTNKKCSTFMVSTLRSNYSSLGQIVLPHYRKIFCGLSSSAVASNAYAVLTGKRISFSSGVGLPATMPWMSISYKEYWWLCRNSVLSCMSNGEDHA